MHVDGNDLGEIEESRDSAAGLHAATDDQLAIVNTRSISWEYSLTGRKHALTEESPLTAVGMTADDQIQRKIAQIARIIFGMMT